MYILLGKLEEERKRGWGEKFEVASSVKTESLITDIMRISLFAKGSLLIVPFIWEMCFVTKTQVLNLVRNDEENKAP